ncbi:MAG: hypothetical protein WAN24_05275 [Candidatus Acidiferrales bacterium]|jgi:hypothetical protein
MNTDRRFCLLHPMSLRHILVAIASIVAAGLIVSSWLESRSDRAQLRATLAAQQKLIGAADAREHDSAAALRTTLDQIAALKRQVQTPQQIITSLPQYLPLPQPITLDSAPHAQSTQSSQPTDSSPRTQQGIINEKGTAATGKLAAPSGSAEIPAADLKPLYDFVQDCRTCKAQLSAANASLKDEQARSAALARERDAAVTAAKGGSFWRRLKRNAKWLTIGAAAGVAISRIR